MYRSNASHILHRISRYNDAPNNLSFSLCIVVVAHIYYKFYIQHARSTLNIIGYEFQMNELEFPVG